MDILKIAVINFLVAGYFFGSSYYQAHARRRALFERRKREGKAI